MNKKLKIFLNGIIYENPLFVMLLGLCPALATTKSVESAIGMAILFGFVLISSNILISLLRKVIPEEVRIPCYIVVIATFVTIVKLLTNAYLEDLYETLGVFISLIVVNCIVLGRAEAYASKNKVLDSFFDGIGMSIGYGIAIILISIIREFIGTGGFTFGKVFTFIEPSIEWLPLKDYAITFFVSPGGAFLVLGIILGIIAYRKNRSIEYKKSIERQAKINKIKENTTLIKNKDGETNG